MSESSLQLKSFKLKGRLYTLTVLQLESTDVQLFDDALGQLLKQAPKLFERAPIVLDCSVMRQSQIHDESLDLSAMTQVLRLRNLYPIGVQGCSESIQKQALAIGLAVLRASSAQDKPIDTNDVSPKAPLSLIQNQITHTPLRQTKIIKSPVRSGQTVVSSGDLIVTASVGRGAELLADGHIHVYGPLRGRALAGMNGDESARIFCQAFDPELVSIAGIYRLPETFEAMPKPCQIYLDAHRIQISPF